MQRDKQEPVAWIYTFPAGGIHAFTDHPASYWRDKGYTETPLYTHANRPADDGLVELARLFHDTYERLAPGFGYETRPDTRTFDPESPNGKLMVAVMGEVVTALRAQSDAEVEQIVAWLREQQEEHARSYQVALEKDDQPSMDRCAARSRSYQRAADMIERGEHRKDGV